MRVYQDFQTTELLLSSPQFAVKLTRFAFVLLQIPGNKMDSKNLATLFGPNILHKAKGREFEVESIERLEERNDVITAVRALIDNHTQVFEVSTALGTQSFFEVFPVLSMSWVRCPTSSVNVLAVSLPPLSVC